MPILTTVCVVLGVLLLLGGVFVCVVIFMMYRDPRGRSPDVQQK